MKKDIRKIDTWLPVFTGFYHSIFEPECPMERDLESCDDSELAEYYSDFKGNIEWLKENYYSYVNYSAIHNEAASVIADSLMELDELGIIKAVTYEKLVSPRYYNFTTDSINCAIEADFNALKAYIESNLDAFKKDRQARYTSYDGFSSSYSSDIEYWMDMDNWGSHGLGSVLDFVLKNEHENAEMALYEAANDNYLYEVPGSVDWLDIAALNAGYEKHLSKGGGK